MFTAGPMLASLYLSFTSTTSSGRRSSSGCRNYELILNDRHIPQSLVNTAFYALLQCPA